VKKFFSCLGDEIAFVILNLCLEFALLWELGIRMEIKELGSKIKNRRDQELRGVRFKDSPAIKWIERHSELRAAQVVWLGRAVTLHKRLKTLKPKIILELSREAL
jgi:hypothetical protein